MTVDLAKLEELCDRLEKRRNAATRGPYVEDDGNVFSKPLGDERQTIIMAALEAGKSLSGTGEHPDDSYGDHPMGYICTFPQTKQGDADSAAFVATMNALPALLSASRALSELRAALPGLRRHGHERLCNVRYVAADLRCTCGADDHNARIDGLMKETAR